MPHSAPYNAPNTYDEAVPHLAALYGPNTYDEAMPILFMAVWQVGEGGATLFSLFGDTM
jgi:hypothetical protein